MLRFALGGLHHQGAGHREGHRWGVVAIVHQPLGDVSGLYSELLEIAAIEDHLVGHSAVLARIEHRIMCTQFGLEVVGVEDGGLGALFHTIATQHFHIRIGDEQDERTAPWRGRHGCDGLIATDLHHRMAGKERREVLGHTDRPNARPATSVRNCEGLVQVEVTHIGTDAARIGQAHLCIHVGTVHIDLSAMRMDERGDLLNGFLIHTVRRRIGHHEAR